MGRDRLGGADGRAGFLPLRTISNFTYEMVEMVGGNRMEANVIKLGFVIPK